MSQDSISPRQYVELDPEYYDAYEQYQPDETTIAQIRQIQPEAHVVTPSRYSCSDCARNLPRMAGIAEYLPGWSWDVFDSSANPERKEELGIIRIPTFIVYDEQGRELGRIIENPASGSLEHDLLQIVQRQHQASKSDDVPSVTPQSPK